MTYDEIRYEVAERVATITLARAERRNAWTRRMGQEFRTALAAAAVGATLPLQWDIRLAGERTRFGFVFVRRGLVPEAASTWILPRLVGLSRAAELLLTGRMLAADEALAWGLVSRVVPDGALLA